MSAQSEGEYAEALENYYEALQLEEDPYDRSYILYNIGLIYSSNGEYDKALEYYHLSLKISKEFGNKIGMASTNEKIGNLYYELGNYNKALDAI